MEERDDTHRGRRRFAGGAAVALIGALVAWGADAGGAPATPPDLSGLAWIEDDLFLGVHDAKRDDEAALPRASLVRLPGGGQGVTWQPLDVVFPEPAPANDLESASRVPGADAFLLAESGQDGDPDARVFLAAYTDGALEIVATAPWPAPVTNVEATAVCRVGEQLVFLYAERADGLPSTRIRWAPLSLEPLGFGAFEEVRWAALDPVGEGARPVVAMDVDGEGWIHVVSAYDPDVDTGPFRSVVWRIGRVVEGEGGATVELVAPTRVATLDGSKVESIVVLEAIGEGAIGEGASVYVGTDDEDYGGVLRPLPPEPRR